MRGIINSLGPWGWAAAAVAVLLVVWLAVWLIGAPAREAMAKLDTRIAVEQGKGQQDTAKTTLDTVEGNRADGEAVDQITEKNDAAIKAAQGAGVDVDTAVDLAGKCAQCLRASARYGPDCQRLQRVRAC